jgi:hypothetical protein
LESFNFHGRNYRVYDGLTRGEIKKLKESMERNKRSYKLSGDDELRPMVVAILKECFRFSEQQISSMGEIESGDLVDAYVKYLSFKYGIETY